VSGRRGPCVQRRLPWAPLCELVPPEWQARRGGNGGVLLVEISSARRVADALGVHPAMGHRMAREGLTVWMADRVAVAFGLHPIEIWGDLWLEEEAA
jgi:hypothetical protein